MSNKPISVVELECRRLAVAASLSKDLDTITLEAQEYGKIECFQDPVLYAIKQEVPKPTLGSNEQPGPAKGFTP